MACFASAPAEELPCTADGRCPDGQQCDVDLLCRSTLLADQLEQVDAGTGGPGNDRDGGGWPTYNDGGMPVYDDGGVVPTYDDGGVLPLPTPIYGSSWIDATNLPAPSASLTILNLTNCAIYDTASGAFIGGNPAAPANALVPDRQGNLVRAMHLRSFAIGGNDCVEVTGPYPLAIVAELSITIAGRLDLSSGIAVGTNLPGAGNRSDCAADSGTVNQQGGGGGGGGGFGGPGGAGGTAQDVITGNTTQGGLGGVIAATVDTVVGGCSGGGGGNGVGQRPAGGLGGGAVLLIGGNLITIEGLILANGSGGKGGASLGGGGGGGSGGLIILDSPEVRQLSGLILAQGGAGGSGGAPNDNSGLDGDDGADSYVIAFGGASPNGAAGAGGNGGFGYKPEGDPGEAATLVGQLNGGGGGGGGGGAGITLIRQDALTYDRGRWSPQPVYFTP